MSFERYDTEFVALTDQVKSRIASLETESDCRYANSLLSQCDELIKQMSVEARGVDDRQSKDELLRKVRVCKARYQNLKDDFNAAKTEIERQSLISSGGSKSHGGAGRERLLNTNDMLESQSSTLSHARRILAETEDVALEITTELGRSREKIESSHSRVRDVSGLTNQARRIIQSMNRREVQQKLVLYVVSFLIIGTMLIIIFRMS